MSKTSIEKPCHLSSHVHHKTYMRMVSCTNSCETIQLNCDLSCEKKEFCRSHIYLIAQAKLDSFKSCCFKMGSLLLCFISLDVFDVQLPCKFQPPNFFLFSFLVYLDYITCKRSKILM